MLYFASGVEKQKRKKSKEKMISYVIPRPRKMNKKQLMFALYNSI